MDKKMEIVKKELKAFKINEMINGYYIRFRKLLLLVVVISEMVAET